MSEVKKEFRAPIFYFNNDGNCFLDAEYISKKSVILHALSDIPAVSGKIEFSFPESDYVVSCNYKLQKTGNKTALIFQELSNKDKKMIEAFVNSPDLPLLDNKDSGISL